MTIKIYYYDLWPSSMATRVMAEELKGAPNLPPIQLVPVDMAKGEHRLPAFLKLNPQGLPPVERSGSDRSRSSGLVSVTSAAPGALMSAGVSRSSVFPDPCGPMTPAVRSQGHHSAPDLGWWPTPIRHPTCAGSNRLGRPHRFPSMAGVAVIVSPLSVPDRGRVARHVAPSTAGPPRGVRALRQPSPCRASVPAPTDARPTHPSR